MAITNNGVRNLLPDAQIPAGYAPPVVTSFSDAEYTRTLNLDIPRATVQNADPAVTMANIIDDATVGVKKQLDDILAADYLATATVTAFADLVSLGNNMQDMSADGAALTDDVVNFTATVVLHVKTA